MTEFKIKDLSSAKMIVGTYGMYLSDKQEEAVKTNKAIQGFAEATECFLDTIGMTFAEFRDEVEKESLKVEQKRSNKNKP